MRDEIVRPVQTQLDAYNEKNLGLFLSQYHDDIEIYDMYSKLLMSGKEGMRKSYEKLFAENPDLKADIPQRMVIGNHVIDEEHITGINSRTDEIIVAAIYLVESGLIRKVTFVK